MTITRTEVENAIREAEAIGPIYPLSRRKVEVSERALHALIEAAKCAGFDGLSSYRPQSGADWGLASIQEKNERIAELEAEVRKLEDEPEFDSEEVRDLERTIRDLRDTLRRINSMSQL